MFDMIIVYVSPGDHNIGFCSPKADFVRNKTTKIKNPASDERKERTEAIHDNPRQVTCLRNGVFTRSHNTSEIKQRIA